MDERPERQLVLELRVIERNGTALQFMVSGPLTAIHEDGRGFEPFFKAFSLSEGDFQHRATPPNAPDFDGPGYTVRNGVLSSGELGLRMAPPTGWRVESRLLAMDWAFASHALFVSPGTKGRVTVGTNVASQFSVREAGSDQPTPLPLKIAGQQVLTKEICPTGSRGQLRVQQGTLKAPEGQEGVAEAQLQLVLDRKHIKNLEPAIHDALANATRLTAGESAEIIAQTTGPNDPQVGFGQHAWFRNGTYFNKAHGLRWSPPEGVWINLVEPSKQYGMDRDTLLMSYNHSRNIIFELRAKTTRSTDLERAHRRGLQRTLDVSRAKTKGAQVEDVVFLGHKAMRTRGRNLLGTGALDFTTILMDGHAIHISVSCTVECSDDAAVGLQAELQAIRGASLLYPELKAPQNSDDRHVDRQFGFSVDLAGEAWTVQPQEPQTNQGPPQVQAQFVRKDGLTMTVSARWVDPIGYLDDQAFARHRGFYEVVRSLAFQGGEIRDGSELVHQGRTVHVVRSRDQGIEWETAVLRRGPLVYTINAWNTEDPKAALLSDIIDRITLDD